MVLAASECIVWLDIHKYTESFSDVISGHKWCGFSGLMHVMISPSDYSQGLLSYSFTIFQHDTVHFESIGTTSGLTFV